METSNTLYSTITEEMKKQGYTISSLAQRLSVNRTLLSGSLTRFSKPLSLPLLDAITQILGYPDGWLYEEYIHECFYDGKPNWRRAKPLLLRCLDINRLDLVEHILNQLMEEPQHLPAVYKLAEELFESGRKVQAIPLYRCVVEHEIKQHSERFAVSHYKWFRGEISRGIDLERYREAVIRFVPYRNRLPEHYQLDALLQLANTYFILQLWDKVKEMAEEMLSLTLLCLHLASEQKKRGLQNQNSFPTERHLVVYYGQSFLLRGNALEKQGKYEEAFAYLAQYQDLGWFDDLDDNGKREVQRLAVFAEANRLNLHILMGRFEYLLDYMDYLNEHADEKIPGLLTIIEAAIRYDENVDDALRFFKDEILELVNDSLEKESRGYYSLSFQMNRRIQLLYGLAVYHLHQGLIAAGLDYLLWALRQTLASSNVHLSVACAAWFEKYREQASDAQKEEFESIMKGVILDAEMDFGFSSGDCSGKRGE